MFQTYIQFIRVLVCLERLGFIKLTAYVLQMSPASERRTSTYRLKTIVTKMDKEMTPGRYSRYNLLYTDFIYCISPTGLYSTKKQSSGQSPNFLSASSKVHLRQPHTNPQCKNNLCLRSSSGMSFSSPPKYVISNGSPCWTCLLVWNFQARPIRTLLTFGSQE